jgi:protein TonB
VAYRTDLDPGPRSGAIIAVVAVHAALLFALLHMSEKIDLGDPQRVLKVFDVTNPPLPPPAPPHPVQPRPKRGASAPRNIKSQATPVVAPRPQIQVPPVPVIAATATPRQGTQTTQGASDVRGPGTGAGGTGTGAGSGTGTGAGGDAIAERAHLMSPPLSSRDFPPEMEQRLASGAAPFVMFTVLPTGRVTNCRIYQSSGDPALDSTTCALVVSRFVYRPAFNRRGEPVASEMAYRQAQ